MSLTIDNVRFGEAGEFSGYLAVPARAKKPLPGVVVIQEAWGGDAHIEDVTRRIALSGYAALAPDVYARNGARPDVATPARAEEVKAFFDELPQGKAFDQAVREGVLASKPPDLAARIRE